MSIEVRKATIFDVPDIVAVGKMMHEETSFSDVEWSPNRAQQFIDLSVRDKSFCSFVAETDGKIMGLMVAEVVPYFFSNELRVCDHLWYVTKEYRGSSVGVKLLNKLLQFARDKGVKTVYSGVSTALDAEQTGALLENIGYQHIGGLYKYKVQD